MNGKTIGYIAIGVALVAGGIYAYKTFFTFDKSKAIDELMAGKFTSQPKSALMTWGDGFIKAWASAAKKAEGIFTSEGKTYLTQGGSAKK